MVVDAQDRVSTLLVFSLLATTASASWCQAPAAGGAACCWDGTSGGPGGPGAVGCVGRERASCVSQNSALEGCQWAYQINNRVVALTGSKEGFVGTIESGPDDTGRYSIMWFYLMGEYEAGPGEQFLSNYLGTDITPWSLARAAHEAGTGDACTVSGLSAPADGALDAACADAAALAHGASCALTCDAGYTLSGAQPSCTAGTFAAGSVACAVLCTRPVSDAYDFSAVSETLDLPNFAVTELTCATGYYSDGSATATECPAEGGAYYKVDGCFPDRIAIGSAAQMGVQTGALAMLLAVVVARLV